jgi:chlorite dismutase
MQIENQEFYHVHRIGRHSLLWKIGNKIDFTPGLLRDEIKSFEDTVKSYSETNNKSYDLATASWEAVRDNIECYIEEEIFEEVRLSKFPHLPSRLCCFYPCCTKQEVWYYWYWNTSEKRKVKIFKVTLTGVLHEADNSYRKCKIRSFYEIRNDAFHYWNGIKTEWYQETQKSVEQKTSQSEDRLILSTDRLFNGTVTILEEINPNTLTVPESCPYQAVRRR